ncbi:hypothetical protein B296_00003451 [Ensete ventricosum]|uniref:Uncharacterized protein n=1 Tax=Ensete ventricosum TaxID=4639 RepID=A0A426XLZ6_ENSVE|nr:hypothetical protein B296_00003451 [Ensete ventricosum]
MYPSCISLLDGLFICNSSIDITTGQCVVSFVVIYLVNCSLYVYELFLLILTSQRSLATLYIKMQLVNLCFL